MVFV
jgi:hypothetical protein